MTKANRLPLLVWMVLGAIALVADYLSGPFIQFPILFVVPVILASWYNGWRWGVLLSILLSSVRLAFDIRWGVAIFSLATEVNFVIRLTVFVGTALLVAHTARLTREIKALRGILPICSNCKKIRAENGSWKHLEVYMSEHSAAEFSHGLCAECAEKLYPEYYGGKDRQAGKPR
jgi:hypothetical protein